MAEQFANNVSTNLNLAITSGATSLTVNSAIGFPATGNFRIIIENEILLVTGVAGTTFTVSRGQESTTAAAHVQGAVVTHILTAGGIKTLQGIVDLFANRPTASASGRIFAPSDGGLIEIDDGTNWHPIVNGIVCNQPPLAASWTAFNAPTSIADSNGAIIVTGNNDGASTINRGYAIAGTASAECAVAFLPISPFPASSAIMLVGAMLRESSTGKSYVLGMTIDFTGGAEPQTLIQLHLYSGDVRTTSVNYSSSDDGNGPLFLRVRVSGANLIAEGSRNRFTWTQLDTRTVASVFTSAPNQTGIATEGVNGAPHALLPHFLGA